MKSPKLILNLDNGQTADFDLWQGMFSTHDPGAFLNAGTATFYGTAQGFLASGKKIDFTANWDDLNGTHITSHFTGTIADDGTAKGTAVDNKNYQVGWASQGAFSCIDVPAAAAVDNPPVQANPAPKPAAPDPPKLDPNGPVPAGTPARVSSDVDVYDEKNEPDGAGTITGMLNTGTSVELITACTKKSWCKVSGDQVPNGSGWVWGSLDWG